MGPPHLITNIGFCALAAEEIIRALGEDVDEAGSREIHRLYSLGLPPVIDLPSLAVMTNLNPSILFAFYKFPEKQYRVFTIPKGAGRRRIESPRVGLKIIQRWLAYHFQRCWEPPREVHGFVRGRSHLSAASAHIGAEWVISRDIANFFPTVDRESIRRALEHLGYRDSEGLILLTGLCSYDNRLSQGAPTSPVLSNVALRDVDGVLRDLAHQYNARYTRYADDLSFSGKGPLPVDLARRIDEIFSELPWMIASNKSHEAELPNRLKIHGLLVHGNHVRLTKGYRNRLRAYRHLMNAGKIRPTDIGTISGHISYAKSVEDFPTGGSRGSSGP